jgi:hypothetical protein
MPAGIFRSEIIIQITYRAKTLIQRICRSEILIQNMYRPKTGDTEGM